MHNRQSNKQVFFSLEFVNILLQMEAKPVNNASSLLSFSGHRELGTGLFPMLIATFIESAKVYKSQVYLFFS